jgi:uncharacterized protein
LLIILLLIIGLLAGVLSGLLGIGGGTIFTPVLFYIFDRHGIPNPELWTIGTSLFCTFAASSGGTIRHIRQHSAFMRESILVGSFGILGTTAGKLVATSEWFTRDEFLVLISVVFIYTGLNFIRKSIAQKSAAEGVGHIDTPIQAGRAGAIGGAGGFIASLSGLGGGVVMVPIMNMGYKFSLRKSVSVSEFSIVMISFSGFMQYAMRNPSRDSSILISALTDIGTVAQTVSPYTFGYIDLGVCLPMVVAAFIGAGLGVRLHDKLNTRYIKMVFGVLLLSVAIRMLMF